MLSKFADKQSVCSVSLRNDYWIHLRLDDGAGAGQVLDRLLCWKWAFRIAVQCFYVSRNTSFVVFECLTR